jgi:hypothetical protein
MAEELGQEMERFGQDMEKWSKQFEKQMEKQLEQQMKQKKIVIKGDPDHWKGPVIVDAPGDQDFPDAIDPDDLDDMNDVADAMQRLKGLKLDQGQRVKLQQLRAESDQQVRRAKEQLEVASEALRSQLENGSENEAEIAKTIENITKLEAEIRKARIISWVRARKILSDSQRQRLKSK